MSNHYKTLGGSMTAKQQHAIDAVKQALQTPLPPSDHKAWARRIVERKAANERISPTVQAMARRALGLEV